MRELFDQLVAGGEAGINRIISERTLETVQLDFKTKKNPNSGRFDDEDKKVYGKALSAFANSSGGLLIWGVDARKGPDGVDCAQAPGMPISDIEQFHAEAIRFSGDLLIPRHEGIVTAIIPCAQVSGAGYLLVQVDRSERRPHRCEAKGDKHYYKRAGDSSFAMEHYDIEDAFRRFAVPTLKLGVRFSTAMRDGQNRILKGHLEIYLENPSSMTAKMPYLQMRSIFGAGESSRRPQNMIRQGEGDWITYSGDASVVVHPDLSRTMVTFDIEFDWASGDCKIQGKSPRLWGFRAECRFGCENSAASQETIELDEGDLVRMMRIA
ncbi:AlbA family DNA-binding domain-containing protein [Methylorubrum rhodesianum]|uniref:AlbA family DNA-binding domain-containing protein n=1 Tax=Methylorubrum rhodesianum TaxID=29427 RepID=UPI003D05DE29